MFFYINCSCGFPIGYIAYRYFLAQLLNYSENQQQIFGLLEQILNDFKKNKESHDKVMDFILISIQHFDIFQILDVKNTLEALINQYNKIYPYSDMMISEDLGSLIASNKYMQKFMMLIGEEFEKNKQSDMSISKNQDLNCLFKILKDLGIQKLCCRNYIQTAQDFYILRNSI